MRRPDRPSRLPLAIGALLVAGGVFGLGLLFPPADGSAAPTQQAPILTGPLEDLDLGNLSIRRFRFPAGSRLGWHTHLDGPQLLMMEDGRGRVQERGGPVTELLPNEPFVTLAGVEHWHGAAPDEGGVQWNIYDGIGVPGSVTWSRAVTDEEYSAPVGSTVERLDPRLDAIVPPGAALEVLTAGHEWVEGPVWVPELRSVLYSDIPNNAVYRWSEETGDELWLQPAGYTGEVSRDGESGSNGLALDTQGRLILAQHGDRRIARLLAPWDAPAPSFETLAGEFEGMRFNSPNDVAVRRNGDLYFTDPPYGLQGGNEPKELEFQGVYRLAADGSLTLQVDDLSRPNGIAFSPDESVLYVANSDPANQPVVMAYDVLPDGTLSGGRVFFESWGDGMAVDGEGNVYVTGPRGGVLIINGDGEHLGTLVTGQRTANATFGDDGSTLYIANDTHLSRIRLSVRGVGF